ncbi:hypothetical protein CHLNCDRAFT_141408 [Chlorella variabilis]|uniref:Uncharacterized protein n=1 Tax=Chlorella variabilis TaxID=554065 RepID=E1ZST5_CHLVA|nr:hypothetical protein CHLNCDRAFT_141408 [Chlorella variabilis]EFN51060.1 hypothetical protein CHLNCDRAFT_141408 [Chlorella variabilis]|eukprot:XP_005843162.1 hypothetical protein CHLNCDRAFT_141408 [Chlorella variabilis]
MLPLKPRSPLGRQHLQPGLPRSHSYNALSRPSGLEGPFDRLLRMRVMRSTLLLLISMVLATNIVWAAQAVAAWHRGLGQSASSQQQLLLQRLNNTTLSVEVSRVGAGEGEHSTYVVNAQLVDRDSSGQASSASKQEAAGAAAAVAASDAPNKREEEQPQQQQHVQDQQEQQAIGGGLVAQLKGVGSALGLIAPIKDARDMLPSKQLRDAACPTAAAPADEMATGQQQPEEMLGGPAQEPQQGLGHAQTAASAVAAACGWDAAAARQMSTGSGSAIQQQHLYSVYIHAPPDIQDEDLPELFRGHLVSDRLLPEWGSHQLVEATRSLLWEAFKDPLNQRFVLVSESDIPLYDPLTLHQQLLAEDKSRVNLCRHSAPTDTRRWSWRMSGPALKSWHWRKSSQWFGMLRKHVEVVLEDVEVFRKFEEHCKNFWDGDYKRWRDCFSDEHYIPTLLASKGLDEESFCHIDGVVATDWSAGGPHPKTYKSWETRPGLIRKAQGLDRGCNASAAIADAHRRYVPKQAAFGASSSRLCDTTLADLAAYAHALPGNCSLTARKASLAQQTGCLFPKPTVRAVHRLFTDCRSKLQLLGPGACKP